MSYITSTVGQVGETVSAYEPGDLTADAVLEFQSPTSAILARSGSMRSRYMIWSVASMFGAVVTCMAILPIDRIVSAGGKLTARSGNLVVQPLELSIVRSINVREGQLVHKGDLLAQLDPTFADADEASYAKQAASLQAEVDRLTAEQHDAPYLSDGTDASQLQAAIFAERHTERSLRLENYRQRIEGLQVKVTQATFEVSSHSASLALARTVEAKRRELERLQVGSQLASLAATDSRVTMERNLAMAGSRLASAQPDLAAMIAERDGYVQKDRAEISQLLAEQDRKLADVRSHLEKAKLRRNRVELRADCDATVLSVAAVNVGTVMQAAEDLMTLVPTDTPLEVEAMINGREAGFVAVGDPVVLKFETFPYASYGIAEGTVQSISPDSFRDPNGQDAGGRARGVKDHTPMQQAMSTVYYRAKISQDRLRLHDLPPGFHLVPGMPVTADVKIGRHTILQYLVSRYAPTALEGLREP
jgi:HlyD family secretion protein